MLTSAGAASGIDLCLHILRGDLGVAASNHCGPAGWSRPPIEAAGRPSTCRACVPEPLAASGSPRTRAVGAAPGSATHPLTLGGARPAGGWCRRAHAVARRFVEDTGYTPMQWVMRARIDVARELLEAFTG